MFDAIIHESLADGSTLAHFCPSEMPGGYVAFRETDHRQTVRAVIFCDGALARVSVMHWHKFPEVSGWHVDAVDYLVT